MSDGGLDFSDGDPGLKHIGYGFMPDIMDSGVFYSCIFTASFPGGLYRSVGFTIGLLAIHWST